MRLTIFLCLAVLLFQACASSDNNDVNNDAADSTNQAKDAVENISNKAMPTSDSVYTFDLALTWNGLISNQGDEEYLDNTTQYFSTTNENFMGEIIHGGDVQIYDFAKNHHVSIGFSGKPKFSALKIPEAGNFELTATDEKSTIAGEKAVKYNWKTKDGLTGEVWFAENLKVPALVNGYFSPVLTIPVAPKEANLGMPLKVLGQISKKYTLDIDVSNISRNPRIFDITKETNEEVRVN